MQNLAEAVAVFLAGGLAVSVVSAAVAINGRGRGYQPRGNPKGEPPTYPPAKLFVIDRIGREAIKTALDHAILFAEAEAEQRGENDRTYGWPAVTLLAQLREARAELGDHV